MRVFVLCAAAGVGGWAGWVASAAGQSCGQGAWTSLIPEARDPQNAMAFDSARGRVVLFGGLSGALGAALGDTFEYDGTKWMFRAVSGPPGRWGSALAYDSGRGRTVLFGGYGGAAGYLADTWEWNGTAWGQGVAAGPSARQNRALA